MSTKLNGKREITLSFRSISIEHFERISARCLIATMSNFVEFDLQF